MALTGTQVLTLIYRTEYSLINKEYEFLLEEEYGQVFTECKERSKSLCLWMLLEALKTQYLLDSTSDYVVSLYYKISEYSSINLATIPAINADLVVFDASSINFILSANVVLATYVELLGNLPSDYDKVISVKVFNEYFSLIKFGVQLYTATITTTDGLVVTHNLDKTYINVQFTDSTGPIFCDYTIIDNNSIQLSSTVAIPNVRLIILG